MITFNHVLWNYGIIKPSRYVCKMPSDNISPWPRSRQPSWEWAGGGAEWQGKGMAQLQTWDNFELKMCELLLEQRPVMVGYYHKSHVQWLVLQKNSIRRFVITEKAPTRAFSWLKAATTAFTFKTLFRHYAKQALSPRSLNVKLGPRRKGHNGGAGWLVSIMSYSRPSLMIIASRTQFHIERPWGQRPFSIVS